MKRFIIDKNINYKSTLSYLKSMTLLTNEDYKVANQIIEDNRCVTDYKEILATIENCQSPNKEKIAYIILGNIGSGKSTLIHILAKNNFFSSDSLLILEDVYKQILFNKKNIPLKVGYGYAKAFVGLQIEKSISLGKSIIVEMVPSSNGKIELLEKLKMYGYKIVVCYVQTEDININIERVRQRILEGADYVSMEKILNRETLIRNNLPRILSTCDELFVFQSNSSVIKLIEHRFGKILIEV